MNNYYIENNKQFNLTGLPEKIRKYYRYDVNCAIQSAWIESLSGSIYFLSE